MPISKEERLQRYYNNQCTYCGAEREPDRTLCARHLEEDRIRKREQIARRREQRRCIQCGGECVGVRCVECMRDARLRATKAAGAR